MDWVGAAGRAAGYQSPLFLAADDRSLCAGRAWYGRAKAVLRHERPLSVLHLEQEPEPI